MINVLIMTHGGMAEGIVDTAQMILGPQERLEYLSFRPDWSLDTLVAALREKLGTFGNDDPTLVMVDLFGGTPSNAIATLLGEGEKVSAVAGVNLPMVLEVLTSRDDEGAAETLSQVACDAATTGVVDVTRLLLEDE